MFDISAFAYAALVLCLIAIVLWLASRIKNDVGIVDSFWSLMILIAGISFLTVNTYIDGSVINERQTLVLALLSIWAVRLSAHIAWRNWGQEEDSRYQTIRQNNQPGFEFKSLYIVFLLQAFLALIVALPLMSVFSSGTAINTLDYLALALWASGMFFETVGDLQLARFKSTPGNRGKVLDSGLWHYTRHPNYFGEFCIWWAFYLFAIASGYWWSIISPLLMTVLLLKVSGVSLLESTIDERRPEYAGYRRSTNAFFPWFPKSFHNQTMDGKTK
jgi:steroid 5-alpha reductase family enzyme